MNNLEIQGVCQLQEVLELHENGISSFVFDLRPKNLNFMTLAEIIHILNELRDYHISFGVKLGGESNDMANHQLDKIQTATNKRLDFIVVEQQHFSMDINRSLKIVVEADLVMPDQIVSLQRPFSLKLNIDSYGDVDQGYLRTKLINLCKQYQTNQFFEGLVVELPWGEVLGQSILDFVQINRVSYQVNSSVQLGFRTLNKNQIINFFKSALMMGSSSVQESRG